jgi:predicted nucleic acid-binding protein
MKPPRTLVDTSVWIDFFQGREDVMQALGALMNLGGIVTCGTILQEVLQGSRGPEVFERLRREMSIWHFEGEQPADFVEGARIFATLRWKGITVPPSDCLIGALAQRLGLVVYSSDDHFRQIPGLRLLG